MATGNQSQNSNPRPSQAPNVKTEPHKTELRDIRAKMRRNYGGVEIEFEIGVVRDLHSVKEQQEAFDNLTEQLNAQHEHFAEVYLPRIPNLKAPGFDRNGNAQGRFDKREYTAKELIHEITKGKHYYKIITTSGRWQKYGCPIWEEELKQFGIVEYMGGRDSVDLSQMDVKIVCEDREKGGAVREIRGLK